MRVGEKYQDPKTLEQYQIDRVVYNKAVKAQQVLCNIGTVNPVVFPIEAFEDGTLEAMNVGEMKAYLFVGGHWAGVREILTAPDGLPPTFVATEGVVYERGCLTAYGQSLFVYFAEESLSPVALLRSFVDVLRNQIRIFTP